MLGLNKDQITDTRIEIGLGRLQSIFADKGIEVLTHLPSSLKAFQLMPTQRQQIVQKNIENYSRIIAAAKFELEEDDLISKDDEVECLQHAFEEYDFKFKDDDFDFIDEGDIVELYSAENIQLYRNLQFLKVSPYDLLTTLTNEWTTLYERPNEVTKAIMDRVGEVMTSNLTAAAPFGVGPHLMKAVSKQDQVIVSISLKYIKPVFSTYNNNKVGFVVTQQNSPVILAGEETDRVSMLRKV